MWRFFMIIELRKYLHYFPAILFHKYEIEMKSISGNFETACFYQYNRWWSGVRMYPGSNPDSGAKKCHIIFFGLLELQHFSLTLYYYFGTHYFRNNLIKFLRGLFKSIDFFCSFLGSMFLFQFVSIYIKSILKLSGLNPHPFRPTCF